MFGSLDAFPPLEDYPEAMRSRVELLRQTAKRRRIITRAIAVVYYACLACLICLGAWLIAMASDRAIPTLTTVQITTPVVKPSADLAMSVSPHLLRRCEGKVIFRAYDRQGNIINQSETAWAFPVAPIGPDRTFVRKIRISHDAVASSANERALAHGDLMQDARLRIERQFFCNPVQKLLGWPIIEVMPDMPFSITSDEGRP